MPKPSKLRKNQLLALLLMAIFSSNSLQAVYIGTRDTRVQEYDDFNEEEIDYVKRRITIDFGTTNPGGYKRIRAKELTDKLRDMISMRRDYKVLDGIDFDNISKRTHINHIATTLQDLYNGYLDSEVDIDISYQQQPPAPLHIQSEVERLKNTISNQRDKLSEFEIRLEEAKRKEENSNSDSD